MRAHRSGELWSDQYRSESGSAPPYWTPLDRYLLTHASGVKDLNLVPPKYRANLSFSHTWRGSSNGYLLNASELEGHPYWIKRRFRSYSTPEMIAVIKAGVSALRRRFPDAPRVVIGDLSRRYGGHFPPHLSHQSGRDADIGYFIKGPYSHRLIGLTRVTPRTIDAEKTWVFLSAMIKTGLVESVFMDHKLQRVLYRRAQHDPTWTAEEISSVFSYPAWKGKMISHLKGHSDHMHIRFHAPLSELNAAQLMRERRGLRFRAQRRYARPKRGESLKSFARRFRVKPKLLMKWNRLTKRQVRARVQSGRKLIVGHRTPARLRKLTFKRRAPRRDSPLPAPTHVATRAP